jgi:hypothetical protein
VIAYFGHFYDSLIVAQILGLLIATEKYVMNYFDHILGNFLHKLIWSPWKCASIAVLFLPQLKLHINFDKKDVGLDFGRFINELFWSSSSGKNGGTLFGFPIQNTKYKIQIALPMKRGRVTK